MQNKLHFIMDTYCDKDMNICMNIVMDINSVGMDVNPAGMDKTSVDMLITPVGINETHTNVFSIISIGWTQIW